MNIFVANLPFQLSENQLQEVFEEHGSVNSVKIVTDKITGRSKGFGFIEMANEADGKNAIASLNEKNVEGRNIVVKESEPRS